MKNLFFILSILSLFFAAVSCKEGSDVKTPITTAVDTTSNIRNVNESGGYSTFYKSQNGFTGDPMPYYNESDKTFYVFFLQDWRNGAPTDHPIYFTKTPDYGSFQGFFEAIPLGTATSQEQFLGTGSFVKDSSGKLFGFYTGHNGNLRPAEKILLATSTDMKTFNKIKSFSLEAPDGYDKNNFRDPCVYYDETRSAYVMLVTTSLNGKAVLARYTSQDLLTWSLIAPLIDFESDSHLLECPDIFQIGNKWYLTFSRINRDKHRKTFYRVSDSPDGPWEVCADATGHHETFDGLYLYAGKSATDGTARYISGWCSTGQQVNTHGELEWAGSLITHKIVRQPNDMLYPTIPDAVDKKFNKAVEFIKIKSKGNVSGDKDTYTINYNMGRSWVMFNRNVTPVKISMVINAMQSNKFGFSFGAGGDLSEVYSVVFDLTKTNSQSIPALFLYKESNNSTGSYTDELNFTPLIVPSSKIFNVKIIIEKSVCVVYVNDNVAFTNRIYKMNQNPWTVFSDNGKISVSSISVNKIL